MRSSKKIGFIGAGNMTQAFIKGLVESGALESSQIYASNRSQGKLKKLADSFGVQTLNSNEQIVDTCDVIFLAMKPQDLTSAIEPIAMSFGPQHVVVSLVAGVTVESLSRVMLQNPAIVRVMTNTPIRVRRAVLGVCYSKQAQGYRNLVQQLLSPLGFVVEVDEDDQMQGLSVAASSGTGFVLELMKYWEDWVVDYGFEPEVARKLTVEVFLGAAMLAESEVQKPLDDLQQQVVSKKGMTAAGLESLRENEVETLVRMGFEKALLREQELARYLEKGASDLK